MISQRHEDAAKGAAMGRVLPLGDPDRHFWLTRSVARMMQIDLHKALNRGDLDSDGYRHLINRCRTCSMVEGCQNWLACATGQADQPPPGCVIAAELLHLKDLTPSKGAR
jgi:hypothetical protein